MTTNHTPTPAQQEQIDRLLWDISQCESDEEAEAASSRLQWYMADIAKVQS